MRRTIRIVSLCLFAALVALPFYGDQIHDAAAKGDLDTIKKLLTADHALVKAADSQGRTALHHASLSGHTEVVRHLIEAGAEVNLAEESYLLTPLHMAVWRGHTETARLLLEQGADLLSRLIAQQ